MQRANLLKGAMAANLLAPSYSGVRQPDGTFGQAYLTELSVNYVAGLERLAEVCRAVRRAGQGHALPRDGRQGARRACRA